MADSKLKGKTEYDYINQCWVVDDVIQGCVHSDDVNCNCYGKKHEGEKSKIIPFNS